MISVSAAPAHELLQRKDDVDSHSTRKVKSGASAAFSSYSFGPLDTGETTDSKKDVRGMQGAQDLNNPLKSHSVAMVTTLQAVAQGKV